MPAQPRGVHQLAARDRARHGDPAARTRVPKRLLRWRSSAGDRVEHAGLAAVGAALRCRHLRPAEFHRGDLPGVLGDGGGGHERAVRVGMQRRCRPPGRPWPGGPLADEPAGDQAGDGLGREAARNPDPGRHLGAGHPRVVVHRARHRGLCRCPKLASHLTTPGPISPVLIMLVQRRYAGKREERARRGRGWPASHPGQRQEMEPGMTVLLALVTVAAFGTWIPLAQMLPGVPQRSRTFYVTVGNVVFAGFALLAGGGHLVLGWRGFWLPLAGGVVWTAGSYCAFRASRRSGSPAPPGPGRRSTSSSRSPGEPCSSASWITFPESVSSCWPPRSRPS